MNNNDKKILGNYILSIAMAPILVILSFSLLYAHMPDGGTIDEFYQGMQLLGITSDDAFWTHFRIFFIFIIGWVSIAVSVIVFISGILMLATKSTNLKKSKSLTSTMSLFVFLVILSMWFKFNLVDFLQDELITYDL